MRDQVITLGGSAVFAPTGVYSAPASRLHMTSQFIGGLRARDADPAAHRVPLRERTEE